MKSIPAALINQSVSLPLVGLGTWLLKGNACTSVVCTALELGYRHIDTADLYDNYGAIRKGIQGYPREELFITSKFSLSQISHDGIEKVCDRALAALGVDYLDLYLLHYPDRSHDIAQALQHAHRLIDKHKVRAIGVSNFTPRHLQDLLDRHTHPISVNQVEFHPYLNQKELLAFCRQHQIHLMSFRSLGKGALVADPIFEKIGVKYGKTPAQICLRWLVEQNISVIPKASSHQHLEEDIDIFDFALAADDLAILDRLKPQHRFCMGTWTDFDYV